MNCALMLIVGLAVSANAAASPEKTCRDLATKGLEYSTGTYTALEPDAPILTCVYRGAGEATYAGVTRHGALIEPIRRVSKDYLEERSFISTAPVTLISTSPAGGWFSIRSGHKTAGLPLEIAEYAVYRSTLGRQALMTTVTGTYREVPGRHMYVGYIFSAAQDGRLLLSEWLTDAYEVPGETRKTRTRVKYVLDGSSFVVLSTQTFKTDILDTAE